MTTTKKLVNSPESAVVEALEGLVLTHSHLQRLEGFPQIKVVINRHHDKARVAVISGGGSGHEPAHAGYVGDGMLAAAVCGDIFASPSTEAVLAAIRAVTGPAGCLLIVKNYTGDRLNFGLAAEQALSEGLAVEMVVVGEDVAIDAPSPLAGRRGLAGTVLVHKAAGAAAARGLPLSEVAAVAARVASSLATLGVGLTVCTLPGRPTSDRLGPEEVELGLGIHGEPGRSKESPPPAAGDLVRRMLQQMTRGTFFRLRSSRGGEADATATADDSGGSDPRVVLLINNLGATPPLEMAVVTREALAAVRRDLRASVQRLYVGPYMTSLDMAGMSLTLLSYDLDPALCAGGGGDGEGAGADDADAASWSQLLELLDAPTAAPAWHPSPAVPGPYNPETFSDIPAPLPHGPSDEVPAPPPPPPEEEAAPAPAPPPPPPRPESSSSSSSSSDDEGEPALEPRPESEVPVPPPKPKPEPGAVLGRALRAAAVALIAAAPELDAMDAKVGDGDCGATVGAAAAAILRSLDGGELVLYSAAAAAQQVARCVRTAVGGSSGALYDILITAAARRLKAADSVYDTPPKDWSEALATGIAAVQKYGHADRGCRTMLDALLPARDALTAAVEQGLDGVVAAEAAAAAAADGAEATRGMAAAAGRASYVPADVLAEVADPGAKAVAIWMRAVADSLKQE